MTDTRRRVKLYALNADRQWDDRGTGHVSSSYVDRLKGISLLVRAESDGSLLLESKIQPDTAYQKQQDTLIVWSEGDNFDLALSFQEKAGCDEIWEKICQVQGKDPSVDITQDIVEESEDERFDDMSESAPPIELPPCELSRLEEINEIKLTSICAEETIFDVVGCLEYDPNSPAPKRHRQYLKQLARFKEVIPISNPELLAKIHQTYRVQYIQDVVLPTPSVFEDNMLSTLSSFIFFNKEDEKFLSELFAQLTDEGTDEQKRRDLVLFLKEFCNFSQNLQPQGKETFYKDQMLINVVIEQMICDNDPELGGAVQLMGILRILLDPENMLASVNKSEKTDFLNYFYKYSIQVLIAPLLANTAEDHPAKEDYQTVQLLGLILELLSFCVEHHTYHIKNCILNKDLLRRILVLMKSTHTFLVLCALRFMRKIIALKDEFYNRYIIKGNLFAPVIDAFVRNNGRYNLLDSAIIEMFEFIKLEDIKSLCSHVVENFGKVLDDIEYVQTFKALKLRYDQHQDKLKDRDRTTLDSGGTGYNALGFVDMTEARDSTKQTRTAAADGKSHVNDALEQRSVGQTLLVTDIDHPCCLKQKDG
ncbi:Serine/threonine-protein phosphatase 4 regulatory subunit 3 [Blattella germanica]|nr:Serine/threonine-protein phosphatase 4 regulatory subunit 3 [Blattella germanica]